MSKYDDEQNKFTVILFCFVSFILGILFNSSFMTSSTEKLMKKAYGDLPKGCKKVFDEKAQFYIDSDEAQAESLEKYK